MKTIVIEDNTLKISLPKVNTDRMKKSVRDVRCLCAAGLFAIALKLGNGCEFEFDGIMEDKDSE